MVVYRGLPSPNHFDKMVDTAKDGAIWAIGRTEDELEVVVISYDLFMELTSQVK